MKKKAKKPARRQAIASKRKQPPTLNPAGNSLTGAESKVYEIVAQLQRDSLTVTSGGVAALWGGKNRSYTFKVLKALIEKELVEKYSHRYYRLKQHKTGRN